MMVYGFEELSRVTLMLRHVYNPAEEVTSSSSTDSSTFSIVKHTFRLIKQFYSKQ